ncbi:kisspeptin 2 [Mugil cephalus]|uniref:kisspeptin 2 n=1 Tax=Mugil cephalus TaxID=48193 RepID=UPI001FB6F3C5|nr:kisspeptin 2 [Mugil cephalus]XP_047431262.1 kisspeptin 2 [Mugil cephalus]
MRLVALVVVYALIVGQDGVGAALPRLNSAQRTYGTGPVRSALRRRTTGDLLAEDPSLCFSLRENDDQRQLLCNDRRSKFNFNPFGLRFGKRYDGYIYRRAVQSARTNKFSPLALFSRELEVPT